MTNIQQINQTPSKVRAGGANPAAKPKRTSKKDQLIKTVARADRRKDQHDKPETELAEPHCACCAYETAPDRLSADNVERGKQSTHAIQDHSNLQCHGANRETGKD